MLDVEPQLDHTPKIYKSVKNKKWTKLSSNYEAIALIHQHLNVPYTIAEILSHKNLTSEELSNYLDPKIKNLLPNTDQFLDMSKAVDVIIAALQNNKKIAVFGDYDVDGATSSALIKRFFASIGHDIVVYIPDRIKEGYGPNFAAFKELRESGIEVIITVDCGSTSFEVLSQAQLLGLKVIVIDHHTCGGRDQLPTAEAIVNPNRKDESGQYGYLAAVGVSFLFVVAVYKRLQSIRHLTPLRYAQDQRNNTAIHPERMWEAPKSKGDHIDLLLLLDLVALGTVCDVVPLVGLNRAFVRQGLKIIEKKSNIGIKALLDLTDVSDGVSVYHLGFVLGPRINAGGRVGRADLGSQLLTCEDYDKAMEIATELNIYNNQRKVIETSMLTEALSQAELIDKNVPVIYVHARDWHQGVIGIIAGKLKERFNKPAAVIAIDEHGIGKASCRSISGIDFGQIVINAKERGLVIAGGGHAMAAGFSVTADKLEDLHRFFVESFQDQYDMLSKDAVSHYDADITIDSATVEFVHHINKVGPFGAGNHQPRFMLHNVSIVHAKIVKGEHISCVLTELGKGTSNSSLRAICFGAAQNSLGEVLLSKRYNLNLIVSLNINKWQGVERADILIHDSVII